MDHLPDLGVLASEIAENLKAALEHFGTRQQELREDWAPVIKVDPFVKTQRGAPLRYKNLLSE
jgi:hypothetical protein